MGIRVVSRSCCIIMSVCICAATSDAVGDLGMGRTRTRMSATLAISILIRLSFS